MRTRPPKAKRRPLITHEIVEAYRRLSESPRGPDLTWADVESVLAELRARPPDEPVVPLAYEPGDWTPKPPPPLALNLNVSAEVPTLEMM